MTKKGAVVELEHETHEHGLIGEEITESIVQWIRTLKKEGVSADTAAQVYVGVLQTAIAAQSCDSEYMLDGYEEFDDEDEEDEED